MPPPLTFAFPLSSKAEPTDIGAFVEAFRQLTGRAMVPLWVASYEELVASIAERRAELVWAPPVVAIELETSGAGKAIVAVGREGSLAYHGALAVRRESKIKRTRDLVGRSIAWVSPTSATGYLVPRLYLISKGLDPRSMFTEEHFAGTHHAALAMLLEKKVDAAAMYAHGDAQRGYKVSGPEEELRVLATVGPIPNDVVIAASTLDVTERTQIAGALLATPEESLLPLQSFTSITRFEPVPIGHLDPLRKLAAFARASGEGRKA